MGKFSELLSFNETAKMLEVEASEVRLLVVEEKRLPAVYVTHMGHQEPYGLQLVRVDDEGRAFDLSGGYENAPNTGLLRVQRSSLERFMSENGDTQPGPGNGIVPPEQQTAPAVSGIEELVTIARARAVQIIKRQSEKDLYPSQGDIADEIAKTFRESGVMGPSGKPWSGPTVKRHALKGISSAKGKRFSTSTGRGK